MSMQLFKNQIYAGLYEIVKDREMFYGGSLYGEFTENGKKAILEFMRIMGPHIYLQEQNELKRAAHEYTIAEIKK